MNPDGNFLPEALNFDLFSIFCWECACAIKEDKEVITIFCKSKGNETAASKSDYYFHMQIIPY